MQLQNLPFFGFGYNPWGTGTPGTANPASPGGSGTAAGSAGSGAGATGTGQVGANGAVSGTAGSNSGTGAGSTAGGSGTATGNSSTAGSSSSNAGASPSTIGSELSSAVSNALSSFGGTAGNGLTTSVSELAVVRESETLKIKMTDGAQITISLRAQGAAFGTAQTQADGSSSVAAGIFTSGQLQVSVKGNLSSADMQAVSDVVSQVNSLATQFFSGDVQDAFAAASNLSVDPTEIAGFSLKLSYSSTLIQQASASGPASGTTAPVSTGATPIGSTSASQPGATPSDAAAGATQNPTAVGTTTSAGPADATTGSTAASAANTSTAAGTNTLSPQQIIINFVQKVMSTLGRSSTNSHSHLAASSRWKLHLLAQALPAYAQAQAAAAASGGAAGGAAGAAARATAGAAPGPASSGATSSGVASSGAVAQGPASQAAPSQGITPAATAQAATSPAASAPQTATNRYPTLQAAKLAADTFRQLAQ